MKDNAESSDSNVSKKLKIGKKNGLLLASLNIVSLRKHIHELEIILNDYNIDILILNETRLEPLIDDKEVTIPGYKIYRNDRNKNGGGVAIYVKDDLPEPKIRLKSSNLELLCLEFTPRHAKAFFVIAWYRPPTSAVDNPSFEAFREVLKCLDAEDREIVLLGDTNCDLKSSKNPNAKQLRQLYSEYQLQQMITDYTRVAVTTDETGEHSTSKSLIDHFSTNRAKCIVKSGVLQLGMVDHYMIYAVRKVNAWRLKRNSPKTIEYRALRSQCKEDFLKDLQLIDWASTLESKSDNPSEMARTFHDIFEHPLNFHAPLKKRKVRNEYAPWITSDIKRGMEERDRMKKLASKDPNLWPKYKILRNKVTNNIRLSVTKYYQEFVTKKKMTRKKCGKLLIKFYTRPRVPQQFLN